MKDFLHLIGPGGAGKTSTGSFLAQRLGWQFIDLDAQFISFEGSISTYIKEHGYVAYALRNVEIYEQIKSTRIAPTVIALSSGFMTYPLEANSRYQALLSNIEMDVLTALLLPSFDLETCVKIIVQRQLSRPYLTGNAKAEELRIRERFPKFISLRCARFTSDETPDQIASKITSLVLS